MRLVMAGGYDLLNAENIEYLQELKTLAAKLNIRELSKDAQGGEEDDGGVVFLCSPSDAKKTELLLRSTALLYTPTNEHFGIVPVEAMYCGLPVLAVNRGGPTESVMDGETGLLIDPTQEAFAEAMQTLVEGGPETRARMGRAGKERVQNCFSFSSFSQQLDAVIQSI